MHFKELKEIMFRVIKKIKKIIIFKIKMNMSKLQKSKYSTIHYKIFLRKDRKKIIFNKKKKIIDQNRIKKNK